MLDLGTDIFNDEMTVSSAELSVNPEQIIQIAASNRVNTGKINHQIACRLIEQGRFGKPIVLQAECFLFWL